MAWFCERGELRMIGRRLGYSVASAGPSFNEAYVITAAGATICTLYNRRYFKAYDGWALAGYLYISAGYTGPILVARRFKDIYYGTTQDSKVWANTDGMTVDFEGITYCVSDTSYFCGGNLNDTSGSGYPKLSARTRAAAALELLNLAVI